MRTTFNISLVISILLLPWWLSLLLLIGAFALVPQFYEGVFYGLLLDAFYGTKLGIYGFAYVFTVLGVLIFFISSILRQKLIW